MNQDELVENLQNQYQIVSIINLIAFDTLPTGRLYAAVQSARKESFNNSERIIVIAPKELKRSYADQPQDIIIHLQKYIQHHDISHYFIIVVTDNAELPNELNYLHSRYNPHESHKLECLFYK